MEFLRSALYFVAVLSTLVFVHEWGHFIVAKLCGMHVEEFSIFIGKRVWRLGEKNGTEYNLRLIPFGGFVKIAGMEPDDISNGAPIFQRKTAAQKTFLKTMAGLTQEALEGINFENVSDRIAQAVAISLDENGQLTDEGRYELNALLASTGLNADEHRYLEAILSAQAQEPNPNGYNRKPLWQRAAVIFAGPFMSLLFGYVVFCAMGVTTGLPYDDQTDNVIAGIVKGSPADKAGLKPLDSIVKIDDQPITDGKAMIDIIHGSIGKTLHLTVKRNEEQLVYSVVPESFEIDKVENGKTTKETIGRIGIQPKLEMLWKNYTFKGSVGRGTEFIKMQLDGIKRTFTSTKEARENVGGPIAIAGAIHEQSRNGPRNVLLLAASLSISLGIVNLFPIPIFDGGHLLLLSIEGIRRRKLSSREVAGAQMVGLAIIGTLFVLVMFNDISRTFFHR